MIWRRTMPRLSSISLWVSFREEFCMFMMLWMKCEADTLNVQDNWENSSSNNLKQFPLKSVCTIKSIRAYNGSASCSSLLSCLYYLVSLCNSHICSIHSRLALYWRHMVSFTLITNIRPTSLELRSAFLATLICKPAGLMSARVAHAACAAQFVWLSV